MNHARLAVVLLLIGAACASATPSDSGLRTGTTDAPVATVATTSAADADADSDASTSDADADPPANPVETTLDVVDRAATIPPAVSELDRDPVGGGGNPQGTVVDLFSFNAPGVVTGEVDGATFLGRDVVLWFWAPWCSWCNAEAPRVSAAAQEYDGEVVILGVAGVSNLENMRSFVERHGLEHIEHVADVDGSIWLDFDVTYQPWWIFVNDDGTVVDNWQGRLSDEGIRDRIELLLEL